MPTPPEVVEAIANNSGSTLRPLCDIILLFNTCNVKERLSCYATFVISHTVCSAICHRDIFGNVAPFGIKLLIP